MEQAEEHSNDSLAMRLQELEKENAMLREYLISMAFLILFL